MINKIKYILIFLLVFIVFQSCSNDDEFDVVDKQKNIITKKVYSNTPGVPMVVLTHSGLLTIKDHWETTYTSDTYVAQLSVQCKDETVLMTGEIYINGKLRARHEANGDLDFHVNIKGSPL